MIGRHPSYHGITLGALAAGSHGGRRTGYDPLLLDFPKVPWDDADAVAEVIGREGPESIAGFLFEPITGAAGACLTPSDDYWRTVEDVCRRHGILLIADEVMTGFRAHRPALGSRPLPDPAGHPLRGQGARRRVRADRVGRRHRRGRREPRRDRLHVLHVHRQ